MTAAEFTAAFHKFKNAQPEWQSGGFTADKLAEWQEQFFQQIQAEIRRQAFDEAWQEVHLISRGTKSEERAIALDEAEWAIVQAKERIK